MARSSAAGRSWVPGLAVVLLGLDTAGVLLLVTRPHDTVGIAGVVLLWLVALAATICVRRRDAIWYFDQARVRDTASEVREPRYF